MKILVAIKRTIDYAVRVKINSDLSGVVTDGVKMSMNPFDEIAVEEALRLKEQGLAAEVVVCTIGSADAQQELRKALAMGADRAIHVRCEQSLQPLQVAHTLLKVIEQEQPAMMMLGKQAIDDDSNQTGQMLAALWQRPQATFVSELKIDGDWALATREVDAGLETIKVKLPAVITTDLRLNQPRYVKMPDIMKAKRKPLDEIVFEDLKIPGVPTLTISDYTSPPTRAGGDKVDNVAQLVAALEQRGVLS